MRRFIYFLLLAALFSACRQDVEHTAPAINECDSVSMMMSYGVNTLISDSGIMKYRIIAEEWEVNTVRDPQRWIFNKGLFMEQFDEQFHIEAYVQSDTAFYFDKKHLWELRGNVRIRTADGLHFASNELFWDQDKHEFYSTMFSRLVTPERTMQGSYFRSDEHMQRYFVTDSKGSFESADLGNKEPEKENTNENDTIANEPKRQQTAPTKKTIEQQ